MNLKIISDPAFLRIPETPLYVSTGADKSGGKYGGVTLRKRTAENDIDVFCQHDFIDEEAFQHCLSIGRIKKVGVIGPDLKIIWDEGLFVQAEKLAILEARNAYRRQHGLQPVTLDDIFLGAPEAAGKGKKEA